jgi:hypothetical protein
VKRKLQMTGGIPTARQKGSVKLRTRNQPHYGPVIELRTTCYGTHGRERNGRIYAKVRNMPAPGVNPLLLLGRRMTTAMLSIFAGAAGIFEARASVRKAARGR